MQQQHAIKAIQAHIEDGRTRHGPFPDMGAARLVMDKFTSRFLLLTHPSTKEVDLLQIARTTLQLAGVCVKLVVDLDLVEPHPDKLSDNVRNTALTTTEVHDA